jgi:glycosyltransferase involved in cell wall biosynthesis
MGTPTAKSGGNRRKAYFYALASKNFRLNSSGSEITETGGRSVMKVVGRRRVAFVFCPHLAGAARLDTMPFAQTLLGRLSAAGWHVDLFVWSKLDLSDQNDFFHGAIQREYVRTYTTNDKTKFFEFTLRFARYTAYNCVFSVGQIGSYIGGRISTISRCPYVLLNDEFPSWWGRSRWVYLECWGARRADAIVVPSDDRHSTLRTELQLDTDKPFVTVPNTPTVTLPRAQTDWHRYMGIPHGKRIFIHAGSVIELTQVPEILCSVNYWPPEAVLLLHSRVQGDWVINYRKELSHLDNPDKVFWSFEPLHSDMLNSLIMHCDGCFALYRNSGPNIELIGTSSGKLMRSIACGTPVITSSFDSLKFVTTEGVGVQVRHASEIPAAVETLIRNSEIFQKRCADFAISGEAHKEQAWKRIVEIVKNARNGIDLS